MLIYKKFRKNNYCWRRIYMGNITGDRVDQGLTGFSVVSDSKRQYCDTVYQKLTAEQIIQHFVDKEFGGDSKGWKATTIKCCLIRDQQVGTKYRIYAKFEPT